MPQDSSDALPRRRWWLRPLVVALLVLGIGGGAFWIHRATEPGRLCKQARAHLDAGDFRSAAITLRRAVAIAPRHPETARLMAEFADRLGSSSAVAWHEQAATLNPDSTADRSAWVSSAIRERQIDAAAEALAGAQPSFRATSDYEALRGLVAIGQGKWREAEKAFAEALRRDPARPSHRFNYAVAQVQSPEAKVRDAGLASLRELGQGGAFALPAKRALIRVQTRLSHLPEALELSVEVAKAKDATLQDHLTALDLVSRMRKEDFPAALEEARVVALKAPQDTAALLTWLVLQGMGAEARKWAESLDPKLIEQAPVIEAYAETIAATNDWPALSTLCARKLPWARGEAMRNAFAALAAEKSGRPDVASTLWQIAVQTGAEERPTAMALAYFAHRAGWRAKMTEVLWAASERGEPEWALRMLHRICAEEGNTAGLLRVARRLLAIRPGDDRARNNCVALALLLGEPAAPVVQDAQKLHEKSPADAQFASTYAFALHSAGQPEAGLAVLEKLPPETRGRPDIALYRAVSLAALGRVQEAREAGAIARRGKLLPEEEKMLGALEIPKVP